MPFLVIIVRPPFSGDSVWLFTMLFKSFYFVQGWSGPTYSPCVRYKAQRTCEILGDHTLPNVLLLLFDQIHKDNMLAALSPDMLATDLAYYLARKGVGTGDTDPAT